MDIAVPSAETSPKKRFSAAINNMENINKSELEMIIQTLPKLNNLLFVFQLSIYLIFSKLAKFILLINKCTHQIKKF